MDNKFLDVLPLWGVLASKNLDKWSLCSNLKNIFSVLYLKHMESYFKDMNVVDVANFIMLVLCIGPNEWCYM